jgi:two-component system, LytTR family, response regulator
MTCVRTLIVDDEYQGRSFMQKVLEKEHPDVEVVGQAANLEEALQKIGGDNPPNLVFLDILLGSENGFELFERLHSVNFEVIFTTAHNEFAVKAFKTHALDYLLKPIDPEELDMAIEKVRTKLENQPSPTAELGSQNLTSILKSISNPSDKLAVPSFDGFVMVRLSEIIYCESDGNYTIFNLTNNRKITSSYTLRQYDEMLTVRDFFRAHKSFLINVGHISRYLKSDGGVVLMSNGKMVEISRRNKERLMKRLRW